MHRQAGRFASTSGGGGTGASAAASAGVSSKTQKAVKAFEKKQRTDLEKAYPGVSKAKSLTSYAKTLPANKRKQFYKFLADQVAETAVFNHKLKHDDMASVDYIGALLDEPDDATHHGRKGMKWGQHIFGKDSVKKSSSGGATPGTVKKTLLRNTKTGEHHEINPDGSPGKKVDPRLIVGTKEQKATEKNPGLKAATGEESSSERYSRLVAQSKKDASSLSDQDLKFVNARTEALGKIQKLNEKDPSWLNATAQKVLKQTAERQMQQIANGLADKYVGGVITGSLGADKESAGDKVKTTLNKSISEVSNAAKTTSNTSKPSAVTVSKTASKLGMTREQSLQYFRDLEANKPKNNVFNTPGFSPSGNFQLFKELKEMGLA